jgi:hypothetical protein
VSARKVVIVGAGKRVREAALPAFARAKGFELAGIYGRSGREIETAGGRRAVRPLAELGAAEFAGTALVYVAVGKPNVPAVLQSLLRFDLSGTDLLIETPVLLMKHFRHAKLLRRFRKAWAAED